MGRHSFEKLKDKWRKQKANRKLLIKQDVSTCLDTPSNDTVQEDYHDGSGMCNSSFGNVAMDIDVIDMALYDSYRQIDGEPHSQEHLKCRMKLVQRVKRYKEQINYLQEQRIRDELRHKQEKERHRKFYDTIAFAQSRTGRMVRSAMVTTNAAKEIMEELKSLYTTNTYSLILSYMIFITLYHAVLYIKFYQCCGT